MTTPGRRSDENGCFRSGPGVMLALAAVAFVIRFVLVQFRLLFSDADAVRYINLAQRIEFGFPEFFFTIPISRIMPMRAITLRSRRYNNSAMSAPTPAEGSVERIVMGWM